MTVWEALLLGIVQGLTEFLPISSTAHIRIVPALLGSRTCRGWSRAGTRSVPTCGAARVTYCLVETRPISTW